MANVEFDWTGSYFKPLILGGPCCVGTPLGEALIPTASSVTFSPVFDEVLPQLLKEYAHWLPKKIQAFDADFGLFVASLYELCSTIHPQTDFALAQAHDFAKHAALHLKKRSLARTVERMVSRHVAISALFRVERKKIELKWWGGQRTYYGALPPLRFQFWNKGQEETQESLWTLLLEQGDEDNRAARKSLLELLLLRSPLSLMVATGSRLPLMDLEVNPLLTQEEEVTPFLIWEDPILSRSLIDEWLIEGVFIASLRFSFWLLESLSHPKSHKPSQKRCVEILVYLLWSVMMTENLSSEDAVMQWAWDSTSIKSA